jgi:hypothetical protein
MPIADMLLPVCEAIHRGPGHVTRCDPSAQQYNPTQCILDPREVANVSITTSGHSTPQLMWDYHLLGQ